MKKKMYAEMILAAGCLICAAGLCGCGRAEEAAGTAAGLSPMGSTVYINDEAPMTITVNAVSTKTVEPDMAEITFGVVTEAETAADAQAENTQNVESVIEKLAELGVEEKSIQTTDYYMYPRYDYDAGKEAVIGYTVTTSLTVKDQTIEDAGHILSECVRAGINNISNVRYSSSRYDEVYKEALKEAVAAAAGKGEILAAASGSEIYDVPSIVEGAQNTVYRYDQAAAAYGSEEAAAMDSDVSLQAGELQITAQVTVTYKVTSPVEEVIDAEGAEDIPE